MIGVVTEVQLQAALWAEATSMLRARGYEDEQVSWLYRAGTKLAPILDYTGR